jgi:hypothetical protein
MMKAVKVSEMPVRQPPSLPFATYHHRADFYWTVSFGKRH